MLGPTWVRSSSDTERPDSTVAALYSRLGAQPLFEHIKAVFPSPTPRAFSYRSIVGVPPATEQSTIQRLDKPLSLLDTLSPAEQVEALFTLLERLELPRLIVLDHFDNLLDWTTGKALPTQPGVGEWNDALGSRPWKSNGRLLLTSDGLLCASSFNR